MTVIDWRDKGWPPLQESVERSQIERQRWNVLRGDLLLPTMVIKESALSNNISLMAEYCREHVVSLAPHGKTTMAPQIVKRQIDAGAWGVTAATISQVRVFRHSGIDRILLANELVEPASIEWVAREVARAPEFDFICLVDSIRGVDLMAKTLVSCGVSRPLRVLVELGVSGGRTGCRTLEEALVVAQAVTDVPVLSLAGVAGFEGIIKLPDDDSTIVAVDEFLSAMRNLTVEIATRGMFSGQEEVIVSAGGSVFFDRVVGLLTRWDIDPPVRTVLRCGGYVTHDHGEFERMSPLAGRGSGGRRLRPALEIWATVLSRPEHDLAIAGFGRRDAPFDEALPVPHTIVRTPDDMREVPSETLAVTQLNDQHAYISVATGFDLAVGDLIGCGVAHPCTAFDKWRRIPVVDDTYDVIDAVETFF